MFLSQRDGVPFRSMLLAHSPKEAPMAKPVEPVPTNSDVNTSQQRHVAAEPTPPEV